MTERPSVTLKIATSIDARIALADGTSQWITCAESRKRAHRMRAAHDAVLVGVGTVLADDPLLTARLDGFMLAQPLRVVADSAARTPDDGQLVKSVSEEQPVLVVVGDKASADLDSARRAAALRESGVSVVKCAGARLDPADILAAVGEALSDRQRDPSMPGYGVLLEGGGRLAASFLKAELVDRIEWFRAPLIIGGDGLPAIADLGLAALNDARRFKLVSSEEIGDDVLDTYAVLPSA